MSSGASEADLNQHLDSFINEIKHTSENMKFQSWYQTIPTSWDESEPVQINITSTIN